MIVRKLMELNVIEILLKNKFVLHRIGDDKFEVSELGRTYSKYPVIIEHDQTNGFYTMYRSHLGFSIRYNFNKFNMIEFNNNYKKLMGLNVKQEQKSRNLCFSPITFKLVVKYTNCAVLFGNEVS